MFSKSSKYAIKAVLYLSLNSSRDNKIVVKNIAKPIGVPQAYTAKLLQELSKQNIISSTRGPKGGFYLSEKNRKESIMNIINAIDGEEKFNSCLLSLKQCDNDKPCPLHKIAYPAKSKLITVLNNKTINDLCKEVEEGDVFFPF